MYRLLIAIFVSISLASGTEYHVAITGNDSNSGTASEPLRTIQHAADLAQPGDNITVHAGIYRERIDPPRGGLSDSQRITYQAATGEIVEIAGSEVVNQWAKVGQNLWKTVLPNGFFGTFNPYQDKIFGDWYHATKDRTNHTGCVYYQGKWLMEAKSLEELQGHVPDVSSEKDGDLAGHWFATVDASQTTIWISLNIEGADPNKQTTEINVRRTVFYPSKTGINYLTLSGFVLRDAATPWAPPTAEQIGLVGTDWSKGWVIENNRISHSVCAGIALGKYGDEWDNKAGTATGYIGTIKRAITMGWSKENIGHHIVRNNEIYQCGQAGIVGSLGAVFSSVTGNSIHDIYDPWVKQMFGGAEMAGIKFHAAVDVNIGHNHIYRCGYIGIWLDWMAQGTRISNNLFNDNHQDLFAEVDHGPVLLDNNIFLSPGGIQSHSQGLAFVHNLFGGEISDHSDGRQTPIFRPHTLEVVDFLGKNPFGDKHFENNVFIRKANLTIYDLHPKEKQMLPVTMKGNVFGDGAKPSVMEKNPLVLEGVGEPPTITEKGGHYYLSINLGDKGLTSSSTQLVTTQTLGRTAISNESFENPDGTPLKIDTDYFGNSRDPSEPTPGPFENLQVGSTDILVW